MGREIQPAVYILASKRNGTLYIGVTSDLCSRIVQHRDGSFPGFSKKYDVKILVWFQYLDSMPAAIKREKQLKERKRTWKLELIENSIRIGEICSLKPASRTRTSSPRRIPKLSSSRRTPGPRLATST
jgi:putative endonuclease